MKATFLSETPNKKGRRTCRDGVRSVGFRIESLIMYILLYILKIRKEMILCKQSFRNGEIHKG